MLAPIPGQEDENTREATLAGGLCGCAKLDFNAMVLRKQRTLY
jgi:hypothetical protein